MHPEKIDKKISLNQGFWGFFLYSTVKYPILMLSGYVTSKLAAKLGI